MLFENVICFDHLTEQLLLITNVPVANVSAADDTTLTVSDAARTAGEHVLDQMEDLVFSTRTAPHRATPSRRANLPLIKTKPNLPAWCNAPRSTLWRGIFSRWCSPTGSAPAPAALSTTPTGCLRTTNPSPYMFFFTSPDVELVGASPETLISVQDGVAKTFPLAGTRPRGTTTSEDAELEADLLADPKELAEHHMLVDLGRNDLGRFAAPGTVEVTELAQVHRYSHVMHLGVGGTSPGSPQTPTWWTQWGRCSPPGRFPAHPKSGPPKLLTTWRAAAGGIYGGALGYIDFTGNMDMCIAIRFAYKRGDQVAVRAGAGIVADSIPTNEYQETINKAKAVVEALQQANGGLLRRAREVIRMILLIDNFDSFTYNLYHQLAGSQVTVLAQRCHRYRGHPQPQPGSDYSFARTRPPRRCGYLPGCDA